MKVCYDNTPERIVENYSGLQEPQLQALLGDPMLEVTEIERSETEGIAVTAARIIKQGRVVVEAVPLKNFAFAMTIAGVISKTPGLWLTHDAGPLRNFWPRAMTQTPSRRLRITTSTASPTHTAM